MELERAGGQARAVLRRTVSKSAADDLARVVATAVVLARRAAVTCDAPTVAAAHLVCDQICEAALDGALANDATKRRAAPAALVAMRWLAATTYRATGQGRGSPSGVRAGLSSERVFGRMLIR